MTSNPGLPFKVSLEPEEQPKTLLPEESMGFTEPFLEQLNPHFAGGDSASLLGISNLMKWNQHSGCLRPQKCHSRDSGHSVCDPPRDKVNKQLFVSPIFDGEVSGTFHLSKMKWQGKGISRCNTTPPFKGWKREILHTDINRCRMRVTDNTQRRERVDT